MVRGKSLPEALRLAADFTLACIQVTCRDPNAPGTGWSLRRPLHLPAGTAGAVIFPPCPGGFPEILLKIPKKI